MSINLKLVSVDDVRAIICRYENRQMQNTLVAEIEKLQGCIATSEQEIAIIENQHRIGEE